MRRLVKSSLLSLLAAGSVGFGPVDLLSRAFATDVNPVSRAECTTNSLLPGQVHSSVIMGCDEICSNPFLFFDADYLFWSRDSGLAVNPLIAGPESITVNGMGSNFEGGVRLRGAIAFEHFELSAAWSQVDNWGERATGQLTNGVAFDTGGSFAGANTINNGTAFSSLFAAAEFAAGPDETLEDEGLAPVVGFPDAAPTYVTEYRSDFQDFELVGKFAHVYSRLKFGIGYRHVGLDEMTYASLSGTFRAIDTGAGANGGLSHAALTNANGGNLMLISGAADGFDDETALLGPAGPDVLLLQEQTDTENTLNGVQFSMDVLLMQSERFLIDGVLKAGAYHNSASGTFMETYSALANDNSVYGRVLRDESSSTAFVGQIGLGGMYRLTDHVRLRGGWDVIFLSGVALAPEQFAQVNGTYAVNNDGTVVINGGHIGLELVY